MRASGKGRVGHGGKFSKRKAGNLNHVGQGGRSKHAAGPGVSGKKRSKRKEFGG